jgi:acetyl esterase
MPLNPQVKALLDQMYANPAPNLFEVPLADARAQSLAMMQSLGPQDVPIGKVEDRTMPGPAGEMRLRIYTPVAAGGAALPALVYFHGGGFVIGDIESYDSVCRALANESGARVISVDYRLAPENKFPAAVEDCFAAVKWIEANAMDLGIDPNRIAVGGDSAGGNLAAVICILARDEGRLKLVFQLLIYPVTDCSSSTQSREDCARGYFLDEPTMTWFTSQYANSPEDYKDYRFSPLLAASLKGLPPALVVTAGFDPLRDEGRAFADKLREAGGAVIYKDYEGLIHGFVNMAGVIDEARDAIKEMAAALAAAFAK